MIKYKLDNGIEIDVPECVDDLKLDTYLTIIQYIGEGLFDGMDRIDASFFLLKQYIDYPLDEISLREYNDLIEIVGKIDLMNIELKNINKVLNINGVDYTIKNSFDELTFGEVFVIKQMIITMKEWEYIPLILPVLLRPSKKVKLDEFNIYRYDLVDFNMDDIQYRSKLIIDRKVGEVLWIIKSYLEWEVNISKRFENLYNRKELSEKVNGPQTIKIHPKWGMIGMLEALTGGDISKNDIVSKINYIECLTILSFRDIQDDYYNKINKNK